MELARSGGANVEDEADPLDGIAATLSDAVPDLYASWAGRWVLIGRDQVHMDAGGLLGCFYGKMPDNRIWASSSPGLRLPDAAVGRPCRYLRIALSRMLGRHARRCAKGVRDDRRDPV